MQCLGDRGETLRQVIAETAVEPHAVVLLPRHHAEAVMLNLVKPRCASW
jgi:hypothetical protein